MGKSPGAGNFLIPLPEKNPPPNLYSLPPPSNNFNAITQYKLYFFIMYSFLLYHFLNLFIMNSHVMLILILMVFKATPHKICTPNTKNPQAKLLISPNLPSQLEQGRGVQFSKFSKKVGSSEFSHNKGGLVKQGVGSTKGGYHEYRLTSSKAVFSLRVWCVCFRQFYHHLHHFYQYIFVVFHKNDLVLLNKRSRYNSICFYKLDKI